MSLKLAKALDRFFIPRIRSADGSGVIISKDGYIVTNDHVIKDAREISVILNNESIYQAEIIGRVPYSDIALIKIESDDDLPYVSLGNSDDLIVGEWVVALGNPLGLFDISNKPTATIGIVSGIVLFNFGETTKSYAVETKYNEIVQYTKDEIKKCKSGFSRIA